MAREHKTEVIGVRLTPTQAKRIRERADEEGRPVAEWLRELALREVSAQAERGRP